MNKSLILNKIKKHYNFDSDSDFARHLGITPQVLSNWKNRNTYDSEVIYTKCLDVSAEWLLTGNGEMLKGYNTSIENDSNAKEPSSEHKKPNKGLPLIPLNALAGFATGSEQVMAYDTSYYNVPEFNELNAEFMIRVKGSSMYPKYNSGDLLACKRISMSFFQWNKVYVLDTEQGAIIKRVNQSEKEGHIQCVSDNKAYPPFFLQTDEINAVAIVLGVIRLE